MRAAPWTDEAAWCALVDALVATVREEERAKALAVLDGLVISALALPTPDAVSRLIAGVAAREYAKLDQQRRSRATRPGVDER